MLSDEEKAVLKTAKENYGLTSAEQKILVNLIEKQEKIINEMADKICQLHNYTPALQKSSWRRICSQDTSICENRLCEDCIIEYFTKKVGE